MVELVHHDAVAAASLMDRLCAVYADAYGVEPGDKVEAFRRRAQAALARPRFDLVTGRSGDTMVGFAFGYRLTARSTWWDGLDPEPPPGFIEEDGLRTVVLAEIEVARVWQGQGIGRALQEAFLGLRDEERATLATGMDVSSQQIYPRWGWTRIGMVPGGKNDYFGGYVLFVKKL